MTINAIEAKKYVIYARRNRIAPWIKIAAYSDQDVANAVAAKHQRDYPRSSVTVEHEFTRRNQEN